MRKRCLKLLVASLAVLAADVVASNSIGAETNDTDPDGQTAQERRYRDFESLMTRAKLVGKFTIVGRGDQTPAKEEEYTIRSVKKAPQGDYWLFLARIKYGGTDLTVPLPPLEVKWAGDTPIITITDFTIPGLGTFSSRVVIYNNKYAGTWTHGNVGGHMFGVIEKLGEAEDAEQQNE